MAISRRYGHPDRSLELLFGMSILLVEVSKRLQKRAEDGRKRPKINRQDKVCCSQTARRAVASVGHFIVRACRSRPSKLNSSFVWSAALRPEIIRKKQLADADLGPVLKWVETGVRPHGDKVCASSPATRHYWICWDSLVLQDGVLFRRFHKRDSSGSFLQLLVPRSLREEILYQMHDTLLSGHLGKRKCCEKTLQRFYWFGVREDVNNWVKQCDICGSIKPSFRTPRAPLGRMVVGAPLDRLATDILGPLPLTPRGNKYILVVTDYFTKWVEIFPVPDFTAATCAQKILNEVIARFGCPYDLHSDQGRNYESQLFADLCRLMEIRKTRTSPGNPRCNGLTERFNKTMIRMIKSYIKGKQLDWDLNLGCLAAAYRATPQESTGLTPNLLMLGREVRLPAEIMFGSGTSHVGEEVSSYGEYVKNLKINMQTAHEIARKHLQKAAHKQAELYDSKLAFHQYKPRDLVWYLSEMNQLHIAPKLRVAYEGPYPVTKRFNDQIYEIQLNKKGYKKVVHHNRLKPYEGKNGPRWTKSGPKH